MEEQKPVVEAPQTATEAVAAEQPPAPPKGFHERPRGMEKMDYARFLTLMAMGMERMDKRQRWFMLRQVKAIRKELNVRWPFGRPIEDIQREIAEQQTKPQIIIPKGINADALKEPPNAK